MPVTELWLPAPVVPLLQRANNVFSIQSTGLDLLGIGDMPPPKPLLRRLKSFDSIVSWYGAARTDFREAVEALGLPFQFHAALPSSESTIHATDFFAMQVGAPLGLIPHIGLPKGASRDTIVIHPFSGSRRKNWPLKKFYELATHLPLPVEFCAGPEEPLKNATRFDNLFDLAVWLKGARLYIGNDSGISHLAAAIGTPALVLFGPTDPRLWAPRGPHVSVRRWEPLQDRESTELLPEIHRLLA